LTDAVEKVRGTSAARNNIIITAYAKDTAHMRKQFETPAEQTQHLTTLAQKVTTEAAQHLRRDLDEHKGATILLHQLPKMSR
jgi:hypothetical protein